MPQSGTELSLKRTTPDLWREAVLSPKMFRIKEKRLMDDEPW
jgi:hypothetical protein